jgi:hypothetical protein
MNKWVNKTMLKAMYHITFYVCVNNECKKSPALIDIYF